LPWIGPLQCFNGTIGQHSGTKYSAAGFALAYGHPYDTEFAAYALLLGVQWANGIGRPAIRNAVVEWDEPRIQALGVLRRPRDCVA
jgi:hypothetical protein